MEKRLFIASSSAFPAYTLVFKDSLKTILKRLSLNHIECVAWNDDGVFKPGYGYLETLDNFKSSYAVALITPDDKAEIKGIPHIIPRDNVIFEYGLFLGKIGRDRTFLITPENEPNLQIMSDLHGVSTIRYQFSQSADIKTVRHNLSEACSDISLAIFEMERKLTKDVEYLREEMENTHEDLEKSREQSKIDFIRPNVTFHTKVKFSNL